MEQQKELGSDGRVGDWWRSRSRRRYLDPEGCGEQSLHWCPRDWRKGSSQTEQEAADKNNGIKGNGQANKAGPRF